MTVTEDTVRSLAPDLDELWPADERDHGYARVLATIAAERASGSGVSSGSPADVVDLGIVAPPERSRRLWALAAFVVLLVALGSAFVAVLQSRAPTSAPAGTHPSYVSSGGAVAGGNGLPTEAGTPVPIGTIVIPIDHTGAYHYESAPFDLVGPPNSVVIGSKLVGTASISSPRVALLDDVTPGRAVVVADFTVASFEPGAALQISPPVVQGHVSQIGPACRQSSGGCGAATEPGNSPTQTGR